MKTKTKSSSKTTQHIFDDSTDKLEQQYEKAENYADKTLSALYGMQVLDDEININVSLDDLNQNDEEYNYNDWN